jgi:hypothetical protein
MHLKLQVIEYIHRFCSVSTQNLICLTDDRQTPFYVHCTDYVKLMRNGGNQVCPLVCSAVRMFHMKTSREITINSDTEVKAKGCGEFLISFSIDRWLGAGIAQSVYDWLRAGRPRCLSSSPDRVKNFLSSRSSRPALGSTKLPTQWVPGALSPGVKRPGCEANQSPTSAEVKKIWIFTSTPPYAFMA